MAGHGVVCAHIKGGVIKVQDRVKERIEIEEMPDGSIAIRHTTEAERRVYTAIFEGLYLSAIGSPEDAADEEPTYADRCIDQCCQACACEFRRPIRDHRPQEFLHREEIMTPTLRRGREKGWGMLFQFTFPLVTSVPRHIWVGTEFIFAIIATVLSSIMFTLGNDAAFNIIHLVLAAVSFALATLDFGFNLCDCCKECCCKVRSEKSGTGPQGGAKGDAKGNGKCFRYCKNVIDFCRTWIAELILYPLLVCDMFEFITGQGWKNDRLGFALFIVSSGALVVYVYIVRLLILFGMIYHVQKRQKPEESSDPYQTYSTSAIWFQLYFYLHVFGQMLVQVLMLIGIGAKIQYDNPPPASINTTVILTNSTTAGVDGASLHISQYLWYMIVAGYILPFFGYLTFFIVTYYWVQEFPIGICLDVLSLLIPASGSADSIHNIKEEIKVPAEKIAKIKRYVHYAELKKDFRTMRGKSWFQEKFAYPFKSPVLVVLCMLYFASQVAFAVCAVLTDDVEIDESEFEVQNLVILNGGNWSKFYTAALVLGVLANLYTFIVAVVWLIIIAVLIYFFFIICFLYCLVHDNNR